MIYKYIQGGATIKSELAELRWHGRGGQGAVTSAELIAQAAISEGKFAQGFPSFGPERRGAPVMAFNRISMNKPIRNRAGITNPDAVIVLDASLIEIARVTSGLKDGGILVINTSKSVDSYSELSKKWRVAVIDANTIAREELGVTIVNTTMLGALIKAMGIIDIESMTEPVNHRFGKIAAKNLNAMKRAFEETRIKELE
jgi:pyruvate ferredoxin oxidoreductase gamma subunit